MRTRQLITVLVIAFAAGTGSVQAADLPSYLGATLGQPAAELRSTFGDPLLVTVFPDFYIQHGMPVPPSAIPQRTARYWMPPTAAFKLISERDGVVTGIELSMQGALTGPVPGLPADPAGISIGASPADVIAKRGQPQTRTDKNLSYVLSNGIVATYGIENDLVTTIFYFLLPTVSPSTINPAAGPSLSPLAEGDGSTMETALLDLVPTEQPGVRWDYLYLAFHPCDGTTQWKRQQSLVRAGAHTYDKMHLTCEPTKAERDIYFDITAFFGKF
jgi:hypothetical protein